MNIVKINGVDKLKIFLTISQFLYHVCNVYIHCASLKYDLFYDKIKHEIKEDIYKIC